MKGVDRPDRNSRAAGCTGSRSAMWRLVNRKELCLSRIAHPDAHRHCVTDRGRRGIRCKPYGPETRQGFCCRYDLRRQYADTWLPAGESGGGDRIVHQTVPESVNRSSSVYLTQVKIVPGLGVSIRLGCNPDELLDFGLGWFGIDSYRDDISKENISDLQQARRSTTPTAAPPDTP